MLDDRLSLLLENALVTLPASGTIAVVGPPGSARLGALPKDQVEIIQRHAPDHNVFKSKGFSTTPIPNGPYAAAIVALPRAKLEARDTLARLRAMTNGPVILDGQKTDGIDAMIKALSRSGPVEATLSKAHGKIAVLGDMDLSDWIAKPQRAGLFETAPGVFSADALDPGTEALIAALPVKLSGHVVDLGAGWGPLAQAALDRGAASIDLVEADFLALEAARKNITDTRASFHWADARDFTTAAVVAHVVCNPPFHTSRKADPALGQAFLQRAARLLARHGTLWLVANRHLPYERVLQTSFKSVETLSETAGYKIIRAERPTPSPKR